jgi:hypothetical protein
VPRPKTRAAPIWIVATSITVFFALTLVWLRSVPVVSGPLPSAAYLWQRQWNANVRDAVEQAGSLSEVCVAYAEIEHSSGSPPTVTRSLGLDWGLLARCGRPVGFGVRVHEFPGDVSVAREPYPTLRVLVDELCQASLRAGLQPAEVQIDFDCPTSRLAGFATWLEDLRHTFPGETFVFTALPAWLHSRHFTPLAHAAPGYILQLHWLAKPDAAGHPPTTLCDPMQARTAVEQAARLGIPFRVALPTYGYRLVLDRQGRLVAAAAEESRFQGARPPPGGASRTLMADPTAMADLIAGWEARRPRALQGVIWYRLPVAGERLNWQPSTLRAVMAGRHPAPKLSLKFEPAATDGPCELRLCNDGEADAPLPKSITVRCACPPVAADGVGGFDLERSNVPTPELIFAPRPTRSETPRLLPAGKSISFGWVRLAGNRAPETMSAQLSGSLTSATPPYYP